MVTPQLPPLCAHVLTAGTPASTTGSFIRSIWCWTETNDTVSANYTQGNQFTEPVLVPASLASPTSVL